MVVCIFLILFSSTYQIEIDMLLLQYVCLNLLLVNYNLGLFFLPKFYCLLMGLFLFFILLSSHLLFSLTQIDKPLQKHGGRLEHNETYCGSCFGAEQVCLSVWILILYMDSIYFCKLYTPCTLENAEPYHCQLTYPETFFLFFSFVNVVR